MHHLNSPHMPVPTPHAGLFIARSCKPSRPCAAASAPDQACPWFNALMTPMRANIVGPPDVATRINAFHCNLPFRRLVLGLRQFRDVAPGSFERDKLAPARQRNRIIEATFPAAIRLHAFGLRSNIEDSDTFKTLHMSNSRAALMRFWPASYF